MSSALPLERLPRATVPRFKRIKTGLPLEVVAVSSTIVSEYSVLLSPRNASDRNQYRGSPCLQIC